VDKQQSGRTFEVMSEGSWNAALADQLAGYDPVLARGVLSAIGVWNIDQLRQSQAPALMGYYISTGGSTTVAWVVTLGRLVRHETTSEASLTVTLPIERVTQVIELMSGVGMTLRIEVDADTRELNGSVNEGNLRGTLTRTTYEISASESEAMSALMTFSQALRLAVGA
jgi:hypothetical protein